VKEQNTTAAIIFSPSPPPFSLPHAAADLSPTRHSSLNRSSLSFSLTCGCVAGSVKPSSFFSFCFFISHPLD
jgi:hypothetical protein